MIKHAMMPDGTERPRCGAVGAVALFAHSVTCPQCGSLLAEQLADESQDREIGEWVDVTMSPGQVAEITEHFARLLRSSRM